MKMAARNPIRLWVRTLAAVSLLLAGTALAAGKPQRVVSLNMCTDQLVLMLANPENIAAVSYLSHDTANSYMAATARKFPVTHGRIEEVLPLEPDLIIAGRFTSQGPVGVMRRLGYPIAVLDVPKDFDGIRSQVRRVAGLLGEQARGEALIADMDRRLDRARPPDKEHRPYAALYLPNGYTAGRETPVNAVLEYAGFRNRIAERGVTGRVVISMEHLVSANPDVLILSSLGGGGNSVSQEMLKHPVFKKLMKDRPLIRVPPQTWVCPGPMLADAVELLAQARLQ